LTAAITTHSSDRASIVLDSLIHLLRVITSREMSGSSVATAPDGARQYG
jgi:hypothetical protein